jgi:voltage-gated potassium channel
MTPQTRLARFERRTEWPLAAVALLFLALYSVQVLAEPGGAAAGVVRMALIVTYLVFVADYVARLYLADPRGKWFVRHLMDLAIIVLPFLRPLRLLSLAVVVEVLQRAVGDTIRGKVIVYTAVGVVVIVYASSLAILELERYREGTKIHNLGDALWWAIATVTTVGYGDVTPVTGEGRAVAVALMVAGVSLLGVVTATLASWIVQRVAEEEDESQAATAAQIEELRDEIRKLTDAVHRSTTGEAEPAYGEARPRAEQRSLEGGT